MSKENFVKFVNEYLPKDEDAQRRLDQHKHSTDDFVNTLVDVGSKNGYEFTREEALDVLPSEEENTAAMIAQAKGDDGGLSDADLSAVAGGTSFSFSNTSFSKNLGSFGGFKVPDLGDQSYDTVMCCW